ncbi:MAG TPA: diguanylate cyclase [Pyrinomonadaceae bacterium]|nr:diguanylate cyclase [Pyrinomonadaceae bacterium]
MTLILALGSACILWAIVTLPVDRADLNFLLLAAFTIGIGSRMSVQIPQFKSHIAVSDTFIFFALLTYGGEYAILLAAVEAFCSSWRFCNRRITVFFNAAAIAFSTAAVVMVFKISGTPITQTRISTGEDFKTFIVVLAVIALVQFVFNTWLAAIHDSLRNALPLVETWKRKYLWSFFSFFVGALGAGMLAQLSAVLGFGLILAAFPVIFFIFFTYRMYLKNVEMSVKQAEQAKHDAEILEQRTAELRDSEQRFRSAFNFAPIGIAIVSPNGKWLRVNRALTDILGYAPEEFLAADFQSMIFADDLGGALIGINRLLTGKASNCQMEQRYIHKDGHTVWTAWSVSAAGENIQNSNLIFQVQDITEKKQLEERLRYEATHDALTGLPNRAHFTKRLETALAKSQANRDHRVSILFIDIDHFKVVNDSFGHLAGDQLLIAIAARLRECLRPSDIVARLGGDEFVILVEGKYDDAEVTLIGERIHRHFLVPFDIDGSEIYSSGSVGVLHATNKHVTPDDLMRDADTAMYHAKRRGKSPIELTDADGAIHTSEDAPAA